MGRWLKGGGGMAITDMSEGVRRRYGPNTMWETSSVPKCKKPLPTLFLPAVLLTCSVLSRDVGKDEAISKLHAHNCIYTCYNLKIYSRTLKHSIKTKTLLPPQKPTQIDDKRPSLNGTH